jgi:uncharacterized protein
VGRFASLPAVIVRIDGHAGVEEPLPLDPSRLAPGSPPPQQRVRNAYTDASGQFFAGEWRSEVGAWQVRYTENEMCVLTAGRIRLTAVDGQQWEFGPGECFAIPAGFEGRWEVLEPAHKFYAIFEAASG